MFSRLAADMQEGRGEVAQSDNVRTGHVHFDLNRKINPLLRKKQSQAHSNSGIGAAVAGSALLLDNKIPCPLFIILKRPLAFVPPAGAIKFN